MSWTKKVPYYNHARRHLPGGSDPIDFAPTYTYAQLSQSGGAHSVTTPWDYHALVPFTSVTTDDVTRFGWDTAGGVKVLKDGTYDILGYVDVLDNNASRFIPTTMQFALASWTTAIGPATPPTNWVTASITPVLLPASSVDNAFQISTKYKLRFSLTLFLGHTQSFSLDLACTTASANWQFSGGFLQFIYLGAVSSASPTVLS